GSIRLTSERPCRYRGSTTAFVTTPIVVSRFCGQHPTLPHIEAGLKEAYPECACVSPLLVPLRNEREQFVDQTVVGLARRRFEPRKLLSCRRPNPNRCDRHIVHLANIR